MDDMMSATEVLARLRIDADSEDFEGAQLGPVAVRKLLRHVAVLESDRWRQLCRIHSNRAAELRRERDELSEQAAFTARHLAIISGVLGSPEPIEIDDIAARLHLLIAERNALAARLAEIERARNAARLEAQRKLREERDEARAELAQAREVLSRLEWDSWGYDPHAEGRSHCPCCGWTKDEGHAPDCALSAALAKKGE